MNKERNGEAAAQGKAADGQSARAGISRREFARRAAIASAVASLAPVQAVGGAGNADASQAPAQTAPSPHAVATVQAQTAANLPRLSPEGQQEVDARAQAILAQYGSRLSDEQKADVKRLCTMVQPQVDRLRAYAVDNGVSPALYLKPLVEREKKTVVNKPAATAAGSGTGAQAGKPAGLAKKP
jgi:hypothetical protein